MPADRFLIVNADDFGQSPGVNRGIIAAHSRGIVTSASLMVRWPAALQAADYARANTHLSVGLHVDLGEWALQGADWVPVYEVIPLENLSAVAAEANRQLEFFRQCVGRNPTHIDSHQHVHLREPARAVLTDIAGALGVPLRHCSTKVRYCGRFYGQDGDGLPVPGVLSVAGLTEILDALPPGLSELACHPGDPKGLQTMYREERKVEVEVLCDPRIRAALNILRIELRSFHGLEESSNQREAEEINS